jgi:hypothetical protein
MLPLSRSIRAFVSFSIATRIGGAAVTALSISSPLLKPASSATYSGPRPPSTW